MPSVLVLCYGRESRVRAVEALAPDEQQKRDVLGGVNANAWAQHRQM